MVTAQAADIGPMTSHSTKLGRQFSTLIYYLDKPNGLHVVVMTQQGYSDKAPVARFETVLEAGQSAAVSAPHAADEAQAEIVLSNLHGHRHIVEPPAALSKR
jgi:hypothetical protein